MSTEQPEVVAAGPSSVGSGSRRPSPSPRTRSGSRSGATSSRSSSSGSTGSAKTGSGAALGSSGRMAAPSRSKSGKYIERIDASACGGHLKPLPASSATEAQNSFSADSPFFGSHVEHEMQSLHVMNDTLRDIAGRTKTFGKCGALMAEATRRLALSCKLRRPFTINAGEDQKEMEAGEQKREEEVMNRRDAVGEDMAGLLAVMSEMLDEIANAQVQMCESFEATLVMSLEHFADVELRTASNLKAHAEEATESAEQLLAKYLNGKHAAALSFQDSGESAGSNDAWNKFSEQVGNHGSTFLSRFQNRGKKHEVAKTNLSGAPIKSHTRNVPPKPSVPTEDPVVQAALTAANLRLTLEQVRLAQATAELKRFQLLKHLVAHKQRRKFEIGENALASLHGVRAYFHHCSDLVTGLLPTMNRYQLEQQSSRNILESRLAPSWKARENDIEGTINGLKQVTKSAAIISEAINHGDRAYVDQQVLSLDAIEKQVQIWDLPKMLAESTRLQRDPAPGVFVEGWLYKKSAARMSLQPWAKRWFMMDGEGIYYFRTADEIKKDGNSNGFMNTLERVKVCDVVLCTVRDNQPDGPRFCFELVTPNQKPLMLQARGPAEFKKWVEGIRNGIEAQLVHGNLNSINLGSRRPPISPANDQDSSSTTKRSYSRGSSLGADVDGDEVEMPGFHDIDNEDDFFGKAEAKASKYAKSKVAPKLMETNTMCADCDNPNPDWVSLNLGVLLCIECSAVHRSLGVHVSKVRSLKLDSLSESEGDLLLEIGNEKANAIWEADTGQQKGWEKPKGGDGRKAKEEWIKSKYLWRGFLEFSESDGKTHVEREMKYSKDLYDTASRGDVLGVASALAHGGMPNWQNPDDGGKTPLHICVLHKQSEGEEWKVIECAELLIQNGAKLDTRDNASHGVLDSAVVGNAEREMIEYLSMKLS